MANSICSSKCRLQKQGRNAAIVPSYQYLAICGLHSSCAETVPAGLTTLVIFSLNHFLNHFNFWENAITSCRKEIFFLYLKKLGSLQDLCICIMRNYNQLLSLHVYATYKFTNFLYFHLSFISLQGTRSSLPDNLCKTFHTFNHPCWLLHQEGSREQNCTWNMWYLYKAA